jgi:phage terminase small subunit
MFIEEYLLDLNGTQAAIRAGFSPHSAASQAAQLLANPAIKAEIAKRMAERGEKMEVRQEQVIRELARIAFANIREFTEWGPKKVGIRPSGRLTPGQAACVSDISQGKYGPRLKLHSKLNALKHLADHLGLFDEPPDIKKLLNALPDWLQAIVAEAIVSQRAAIEGP